MQLLARSAFILFFLLTLLGGGFLTSLVSVLIWQIGSSQGSVSELPCQDKRSLHAQKSWFKGAKEREEKEGKV